MNHPRVTFRLPIKRVFLDRFPFAVVFYVENDTVYVVALEETRLLAWAVAVIDPKDIRIILGRHFPADALS